MNKDTKTIEKEYILTKNNGEKWYVVGELTFGYIKKYLDFLADGTHGSGTILRVIENNVIYRADDISSVVEVTTPNLYTRAVKFMCRFRYKYLNYVQIKKKGYE